MQPIPTSSSSHKLFPVPFLDDVRGKLLLFWLLGASNLAYSWLLWKTFVENKELVGFVSQNSYIPSSPPFFPNLPSLPCSPLPSSMSSWPQDELPFGRKARKLFREFRGNRGNRINRENRMSRVRAAIYPPQPWQRRTAREPGRTVSGESEPCLPGAKSKGP